MMRLFLVFSACALVGFSTSCGLVSRGNTGSTQFYQQSLLNSERIELKFGSYGIDVLEQQPIRVSNLYSMENGGRVCRTFALVVIEDDPAEALEAPLTAIRAGASLGATLKANGWIVTKQTLFLGEIEPGARFKELADLNDGISLDAVAVHIYQLNAESGGFRSPVARIVEVHHPEYLDISMLGKIYTSNLKSDQKLDKEVERLLKLTIQKMK